MEEKQLEKNHLKIEWLAGEMTNLIHSESFLQYAKLNKEAFTRNRLLPFPNVVGIIINQVRSTIQTSMNEFAELPNNPLLSHQQLVFPTQQAFSKARQNIRWEAFEKLVKHQVKLIYEHEYKTYLGYRLSAEDGSKFQIPSDEDLRKNFGTVGRSSTAPTAQVSNLFDVLNNVIIDVRIARISDDERTLAMENLTTLKNMPSFSKELVLFDRGYPSFELIKYCESIGISYLMRVKTKFNVEIDEMPLGIYKYTLRQENEEFNLRVIKFVLPKGEIEALITNFIEKTMNLRKYKGLYFMRWPIEV
jgi:hypothetical protein